jgi:protein-S-isoprenylcysteine O-methyltransferase
VLFSCVEFWVELYFVPGWKLHPLVRPVGIALVIVGQFFRVSAMSTAANNFSHRIEYFKRKEHQLVTHGVFHDRIPYVGCGIPDLVIVGFAYRCYACSRYEEQLLLGFFPDEYPAYKARTISGIPFV